MNPDFLHDGRQIEVSVCNCRSPREHVLTSRLIRHVDLARYYIHTGLAAGGDTGHGLN